MNNKEKYDHIFMEVFGVESSELNDNFGIESIALWDSVHQLNIINLIEDAFDIMLDPEQIMSFTSYQNGRNILRSQGIEI